MSGSLAPPTLAGFTTFIYNVMMIDPLNLPTTSTVIPMAYNVAIATVNAALAALPGGLYELAVYNLGGSNIINFAQDQPGRRFFTALRQELKISSFQPGLAASTGDGGTSISMLNPEFMKNLTLSDLRLLKDPYGRLYLELAQSYGPSIVDMT